MKFCFCGFAVVVVVAATVVCFDFVIFLLWRHSLSFWKIGLGMQGSHSFNEGGCLSPLMVCKHSCTPIYSYWLPS